MKNKPDWMPADPYPLDLGSIKNGDDLVKIIPDPQTRKAVTWYLCGAGFRVAEKMILKSLKDHLECADHEK